MFITPNLAQLDPKLYFSLCFEPQHVAADDNKLQGTIANIHGHHFKTNTMALHSQKLPSSLVAGALEVLNNQNAMIFINEPLFQQMTLKML